MVPDGLGGTKQTKRHRQGLCMYFAIANTKKKKLVADFVTTYLG